MRDASRGRWSAERESSPGGRVGEISVSQGKLSEEQLRTGVEAKKTDPRRIGEILLSLGFVSEEDLARAVAEAGGLEYMALTEDSVDPATIPLLGEKALRTYVALPLKVENGRLVLAVSDPTNVLALDDLKTLSGRPIRPVVALEEDIKKLQDRVFGIDEEISELVETSGDGSRRGDEGGTLLRGGYLYSPNCREEAFSNTCTAPIVLHQALPDTQDNSIHRLPVETVR